MEIPLNLHPSERCHRWYLIRTKQHRERMVKDQLSGCVLDTFLPFLRTTRRNWGRRASSIEPLFPTYLFGLFDLDSAYPTIMRTPGVVSLVRLGGEPAEVSHSVVEEIRRRAVNDIVEPVPRRFRAGELVQIENALFGGLNAVFERYLSAADRVAVLLSSVAGANIRVVLPADQIAQRG